MPKVRAQCPLCKYGGSVSYDGVSLRRDQAVKEALSRVGMHIWSKHPEGGTDAGCEQLMFSNGHYAVPKTHR